MSRKTTGKRKAAKSSAATGDDAATRGNAKGSKAKSARTGRGGPRAKSFAKGGKVSALDAAATVLASAKQPMRTKELVEQMAAKNLWSSPNGKTPEATLHAALMREIKVKGNASRFKKAERGLFASTGKAA